VTIFSLAVAFGGGIASFTSPCVLPLVPAYLSVIGGLDLARRSAEPVLVGAGSMSGESGGSLRTRRGPGLGAVTFDTALFVGGFGTVFVLLGLSASAVGRAVIHQQGLLTRVSGVLIVAMALFLAGGLFLRAPGIYGEWRLHPRLARFGRWTAPVAGAAFAFGWTPCVGPILASVLALSSTQGHAGGAALLLGVYSLGLGLPFLLVAAFFDHLSGPLAWLRRHGNAVTAISAGGLGVLGVLLTLDRLAWVTTQIQNFT